jgi:hypothetical protein
MAAAFDAGAGDRLGGEGWRRLALAKCNTRVAFAPGSQFAGAAHRASRPGG